MNFNQTLLIDKPSGMSSFGVVARVRRILTEQVGHKIKVGHAGTLDPFATGLLVLLTGKNTKKATEFLKLDKWYEATIELGQTTTTGDIEGDKQNIISDYWPVEREKIEAILPQFTGTITQKLPQYSAIKINGQRAYKLARAGQQVDMPSRQVEVYQLEIVKYRWPHLTIRCHVSSGTYIRTLGVDIGEALGTGGYLTELRRTQIGNFKIEDATPLDVWMNQNSKEKAKQ